MKINCSANNRIYIFFILLFLVRANVSLAQDPEFSQYYANPIYTNPAFAGSSGIGRMVTDVRNQWSNITGSFRTISASYDEHYDVINGGIGIMLTGDEAGTGLLQTISLTGIYSYQINISRYVTMRAAVQGSIVQKSISFGKLTFFDQIALRQGFVYNTNETPIAANVFYPNVAAGAVIYTSKFYGGVAVHNINEPVNAFYSTDSDNAKKLSTVPIRYTVHAGLVIPLVQTKDPKNESNLWPNIMYMQQSTFAQLNIGLYYNKGPFVLGMYYRQTSSNGDALIGLVGIRLQKLRIGYSYDQTISNAYYGATNSHEITVAFDLRKRIPKKTIRAIKCPEF